MILLAIYLVGFAVFLWSFYLQEAHVDLGAVVWSLLWVVLVPVTFLIWIALSIWICMTPAESKTD